MDKRKVTGRLGETAAALFLEENGVSILEKNFRSRFGEIDLIGYDGESYLVIEVKTRVWRSSGSAAEAVDYHKQVKICRTFDYYRMKKRLNDFTPVRFDVVNVDQGFSCTWIKNAFEYLER